MNQELLAPVFTSSFRAKEKLDLKVGYFRIKTIETSDELLEAMALRYQVFQVETLNVEIGSDLDLENGFDHDQFDAAADHLAIMDERTKTMVATCRLNCSRHVKSFYSEQEFHCESLIARPEVKLEVGRVCVHRQYRKGAIILMLWRAIGQYLMKTEATILFGCGSVMTQDPKEAWILLRHLEAEGKVQQPHSISPTENFRFHELESMMQDRGDRTLTLSERAIAKELLPPLCQSYFDIGCYVPGGPALDRDFKCIDFLTILELSQLDAKVKQKMLGSV